MKRFVFVILPIAFFGLIALVFADQMGENLRSKGFHVAILSDEDKINLQVNRLEQTIRQQWIGEIEQMLSSEYKESEPSIYKTTLKEKLESIFSNLSSVRQFITQTNTETGWRVTSTQDFYIRNLGIRISAGGGSAFGGDGDNATVECEIGLSSARQNFKEIKEVLSFVLENQKWALSGTDSLFGFLENASQASIQEIGTINLSSEILNQSKDDFTSTHLLVPVTLYNYGKTLIPRFNKTESLNWFGVNSMNSPCGIIADIEICAGGPDFNHEYLFISDVTSNKIIGSDQDNWVGEFGSQGSGVGQFWGPKGICTVEGYYYFVADMFNDRVTAYIYYNQLDEPQWYSDLNLYANFNRPRDVEAKDKNPYDLQDKTYIAVTDAGNHRLALFLWHPFDLRLDRYYGGYGSGEGQFMWPTSVCFGRDPQFGWQTNDIFVTDYGNRRLVRLYAQLDTIYMIHWRGTYEFPAGTELTSVDVDNQGLVYVVDRRNGKVYKFAPSQGGYPWHFSLLGIWGETGVEDGQLYHPNTIQVTHGRYVPYPDPWVPLNSVGVILGDVFVTESWGDQTGVRRFVIAADVLNLAAEWVPYNEYTGEGNFIWWEYSLTDFGTVTEEVLLGAEICTTYNEGSLNWGSQAGSWPVDGHPHGTYYTVKITATSIYDPTIVVEKSVDVYVDTLTIHDPVITRGIRCKHDDPFPYWCGDGYQCIKEYHFYTIDVQAYDPDGDPLTYEWSCAQGRFWDGTALYKEITTSENYVCYLAPPPPGGGKPPIYEQIGVTIRNPYGGEAQNNVDMDLYLYPSEYSCLCGDANHDSMITSADIVKILNYLYRGYDPPPDPIERGDVNNDCEITAGDVTYLLNYLYRGGPPPECCWLHE